MTFEIWVVFPDTMRSATSAVRALVRRACHNRAWLVQEKRSRTQRVNGRPVEFLAASDAINLYRRAHRVRVAVWFFGKPFVPLSPDARSSTIRKMTLARFVRYKAHSQRLASRLTDVSTHLDSCEAWRRGVGCEDGHDPRCFPLHLFSTDCTELDSPPERVRFDEVHGAGARRVDGEDLRWQLDPSGFHGRDVLHVAGCKLARGFHWDVSVSRGHKMITTGKERWRVLRYINIAPDAHLRGRAPYAKKLYG